MAAELIAFKSLFPSPLGYVNFGESNRELNKQLVEDIEIHIKRKEVCTGLLKLRNANVKWFLSTNVKLPAFTLFSFKNFLNSNILLCNVSVITLVLSISRSKYEPPWRSSPKLIFLLKKESSKFMKFEKVK